MPDQPRKLRELIARPGPIVIIGAHNGLSARIGQEAGFDGLWASGFEISASYAVPDANILATMADVVLLVVQAGRTPARLVQRTADALGRERIMGVILNRADDMVVSSDSSSTYAYGPNN